MDEAYKVLYGKIMSKMEERAVKIDVTDVPIDPLESLRKWCDVLELNGIHDIPIVHIAGTKGKGSSSAFCERVLRSCGLKTGTQTIVITQIFMSQKQFLYCTVSCAL